MSTHVFFNFSDPLHQDLRRQFPDEYFNKKSNWQILEKLARKPYQIANNLVHFEARNHLIMKEFVVRSYYK
ncbi:hypothetical protein TcasGA2_TC034024 [Tribolium castaneum]|uniref:Uncharacterized protein n=1 Tax=Tribolium castaneum TaxID=7070 RepID=A0A139WDI7_TRICA|nr:hypothetical protein TcasGA2_TC034024 [Tribolium castaneum]